MKAKRAALLALVVIAVCSVLLALAFDFLGVASSVFSVGGMVIDDSGSPVSGALVSTGIFHGVTDSSGNYALRIPCNMLQNPMSVSAEAPGCASRTEDISPSGSTCTLNFTLTRRTVVLEGWVTDDNEWPIAGASVGLGDYATDTDLNGAYTLNIPQNVYQMSVSATNFETFSTSLNATLPENLNDSTEPTLSYNVTLYSMEPGAGGYSPGGSLSVDGILPEYASLFLITGPTETPYIRDTILENYGNGVWQLSENTSKVWYTSKSIQQSVGNYAASHNQSFQLQPLQPLGGFIPSALNPNYVQLASTASSLMYYVEQQTFFSTSTFDTSYNVSYTLYDFSRQTLESAKTILDGRYLGVPTRLSEKLEPLAANITKNANSPYEKLLAIQSYLKENYWYDTYYPRAPAGTDPVEWFLFNSKRGVCTHFNSAFVLLARSIGILARLCRGYLVDPAAYNQTVNSMQSHAYAEVLFDQLGWITFDATGSKAFIHPSVIIEYPTEGSHVSDSTVYVNGTVDGSDMDDMRPHTSDSRFVLADWDSSTGEFSFVNAAKVSGEVSVTVFLTDQQGTTTSDSVTFYADLSRPLIPTVTSITYCSPTALKGSSLIVIGKVVDNYGNPVNGLTVLTSLTPDKSEPGIICGQGIVLDGSFNVTCSVAEYVNVGDYIIIAHCLSDDKYNESWSDPWVRILAETVITSATPAEAIMGRSFTVSGTLMEKLAQTPVPSAIVLLNFAGNNHTLVTDENGFFGETFSVWTPGNYTITMNFGGTDYYLGSVKSATLRILDITIFPTTNGTLVRSQYNQVDGHVNAEDMAVDFEFLQISLNDTYIGQAWTDKTGYFSLTFILPFNETLGPATLTYVLEGYGRSAEQQVRVMAQTFLTINPVPVRIGSKESLNFTLTLKDDFQEPMVGEKIVLNGSILGSTFRIQNATDAFGTVDFLNVTLPASHSGSLTYIASFEGEINYLPSSFSGTVDVVFPEQGDMTWLIPVIAVPVGGGSVSTYLWRKKREGADEESVTPVETEVSVAEVAPVTVELKNRLNIDFPQIRPSLPNVWGAGESLTVRLRLEDSLAKPIPSAGVTLKVDSGSGRRLKTSNEGFAEVAHVFEGKGMHSLEGVYAHGAKKEVDRGFAEIRIVEYREEVVALFNSFFNAMSNKFPNIKKTTPREFQAFVAGNVSGSKVRSLDTIVLLFEIADYSLHSVKREEYEQMYLALKEFDEAAA